MVEEMGAAGAEFGGVDTRLHLLVADVKGSLARVLYVAATVVLCFVEPIGRVTFVLARGQLSHLGCARGSWGSWAGEEVQRLSAFAETDLLVNFLGFCRLLPL